MHDDWSLQWLAYRMRSTWSQGQESITLPKIQSSMRSRFTATVSLHVAGDFLADSVMSTATGLGSAPELASHVFNVLQGILC